MLFLATGKQVRCGYEWPGMLESRRVQAMSDDFKELVKDLLSSRVMLRPSPEAALTYRLFAARAS